jgi:hypothetical protein
VLSGSCYCILLRKHVCGLAEHVYAKSHWLKGPSPVSYPIGGRLAEIEGDSESVHSVNKIQVLRSMIGTVNVSRMQTVYV